MYCSVVRAARFSSSAAVAPVLESSVLPNGVRVITLNEPDRTGPYLSKVALKIHAGTKDETAETAGVNHALRFLAYQRSFNKSPLRVVRELEISTASFSTLSTRDALFYLAALPTPSVPHFMENVYDFVTPKLREYILRDLRPLLAETAAQSRREGALEDLGHAVAFNYQGYGRSLAPSDAALAALTPQRIATYYLEHFIGPKISVLGYRVDHNTLVEQAKEKLSEIAPTPDGSSAPSTFAYTGGSSSQHTDGAKTQVLLGFGAPSIDAAAPLRVAAEVLGSNLGKNPGDGNLSRLSAASQAHPGAFARLDAQYAAYEKAGFFFIRAEGKPGGAKNLTEVAWEVLQNLGSKGVSTEEVERAKRALARKEEERVGDGFLLGESVDVSAVDVGQVNAALKKVLGGAPTIVTLGDARGAVNSLK